MSVDSKRENRLSTLFSLIKVNTQNGSLNTSMIKAIDAGMKLVENYFDEILSEIFVDTAQNYGLKMMCDLFDIKPIDSDAVKNGFSQGFVNYKYGEFEEESQKAFAEILELSVSNFILNIKGNAVLLMYLIIYNIPFIEKYLCPGVVPRADTDANDFDNLDDLDCSADDWDEIGKMSFNFIDSLGGVE